MEAVDAGDVPLGVVIDSLLSPSGLQELIGPYRAACFVLARQVIVKDFFQNLIQNVDAIDETLRDNVAFVVFHGQKSSLTTRPDPGRYRGEAGRPDRWEPARRYHVEGLSISDDRSIEADRIPSWNPRFDDDMMVRVRQRDVDVPADDIAVVSQRATGILARRFGVAESNLPVLLFLDGGADPEPLVLRLDPAEPIASLYANILAPLGDEFARLGEYWKLQFQRGRLGQRAGSLDHIRRAIGPAEHRLAAAEAAIVEAAAPRNTPADKVHAAELQLEALVQRVAALEAAESLDERIDLLPPGDLNRERLAAKCAALAALLEHHQTLSAGDKAASREEIVAVAKAAHALRGEIGRICKESRVALAAALDRLRTDPLERVPPELFDARDAARARLDDIRGDILRFERGEEWVAREIERIDRELAQRQRDLREAGYGETFLSAPRPDSMEVVRNLVARGLIKSGPDSDSPEEKTRTKVPEGIFTKVSAIAALVALVFGAIQVWPILAPEKPGAQAPAVAAPSGSPSPAKVPEPIPGPPVPAKASVTVLDSERPTREAIYALLSTDDRSDVELLAKIEDSWISLAKGVGCRTPDVVVAHLHAFRTKKGGELAAEEKLLPGLLEIARHSGGTRFVLYSSTFGRPDGSGRSITRDRAELLERLTLVADRLAHDAATRTAYKKMLERTTFVVWPLKASLSETNRQELLAVVRQAGGDRFDRNASRPAGC